VATPGEGGEKKSGMELKILRRREPAKKGFDLKPVDLLSIGVIVFVLSYTLYPLRAHSIIPGLLIGGGIAGLVWIAYRVLYTMGK